MRSLHALVFFSLAALSLTPAMAQPADTILTPNIRSILFYPAGNPTGYPVVRFGAGGKFMLQFDDLDNDVKNYFYTYQLCDADWTPVQISTFDYIKGFEQTRISQYRYSSQALVRYTHWSASVPDLNSGFTRSGNYLLKVFLDGDTSKLVFTRRFIAVESGASVSAQWLQPNNPAYYTGGQKLQFTISAQNLGLANPLQQIKVVILQNNRWENALRIDQPSFYSNGTYTYNSDDGTNFFAGNQWRWVDLERFRFQSDRVARADYGKTSTTIYVKPDGARSAGPYAYYNDLNGNWLCQNNDGFDPYYQSDYATVRFTFVPPGNQPYAGKDVYIIGRITDYKYDDRTRLHFVDSLGAYQVDLFLKQGYYNYAYVTVDPNDPAHRPSFSDTEGNFGEAENDYTILVYYRALGGRADQLVGMATLNTGPPSQ